MLITRQVLAVQGGVQFIKAMKDRIAKVLSNSINEMFQSKRFPKSLKIDWVTPIFKDGDKMVQTHDLIYQIGYKEKIRWIYVDAYRIEIQHSTVKVLRYVLIQTRACSIATS
jgi:hypothetical protein